MSDDLVTAALTREHRRLFDYGLRRLGDEFAMYEPCPGCGSTSSKHEFSKDWFNFDRCRECGMVGTNPRLNDQTLADFYNGDYTKAYNATKFFAPGQQEVDAITTDARRFLSAAAPYQPSGRFLEVGAGGEGTMMAAALAAGYEVTAVEVTTECVAALRRRFGDSVTVIHADIYDASLEPRSFNVIVMRDVLEHIPHPRRFLRALSQLAIEDAVLLVQVPNVDGLIYRLVRQRHTVIFGFEHVNYWTVSSLSRALSDAGFDVVDVEHQSVDFTLSTVHSYLFGRPTFTTVLPPPPQSPVWRALGRITWPLVRLLRPLDHRLLPKLANRVRRGSVMTVVARRRADQPESQTPTAA